jgi:hypothetical protein
MQLFLNITPYTVISIETLLFGFDNLADENNLIVLRNVQKYMHHTIDLDDMKLYSVLRMLSHICTQFPFPLFSHHFCLLKILCIHLM